MVITRGVDLTAIGIGGYGRRRRGTTPRYDAGDVKERSDPARAADRRPPRGRSDHDEAEAKHRQSQKLKHNASNTVIPQQTVDLVGNALTVS